MEKDREPARVTLSVEEYEEMKSAKIFLEDFKWNIASYIKDLDHSAEGSLHLEFHSPFRSDGKPDFTVDILYEDAYRYMEDHFRQQLAECDSRRRECYESQIRLAEHESARFKKECEELQDRIDKFNNGGLFYRLFNEV